MARVSAMEVDDEIDELIIAIAVTLMPLVQQLC
jgi:hypothetical protein